MNAFFTLPAFMRIGKFSPLLITVILGTAPLSAATVTWGGGFGYWYQDEPGTGNWLNGATFHDGDSAVFTGSPATVFVADSFNPITAADVLFDSNDYTLSKSANFGLQVNSLKFGGTADRLNITNGLAIALMQANAVTSGTFTLSDTASLDPQLAGALNGGAIVLRNNSSINSSVADGTTKNATVTFDNTLGGTGGFFSLAASTTIGRINSVGTGAGVIQNSAAGTLATLTVDFDSDTSAFSGIIQNGSGTLALTKKGAGTLTLTGTNTYRGGTTINEGKIIVAANNALGNDNGTLTLDGGTLQASNGLSLSRRVHVGDQGGVLDSGGHDVSLLFLEGTGTFAKVGGGALTLVGSSTYRGTLSVQAGTFELFNDKTLQIGNGGYEHGILDADTINNGHLIFNRADDSSYTKVLSGTGTVTKMGPGVLSMSANNSYTGDTILQNGGIRADSGGALGLSGKLVFDGGYLQYGAGNTTDYSSRFSTADNQQYRIDTNGHEVVMATSFSNPTSTLEKMGAGRLIVTGSNNLPAGITLSGGELVAASWNALGSTEFPYAGTINFQGGTLYLRLFTDGSGVYSAPDYSHSFSNAPGQRYSVGVDPLPPHSFGNILLSGDLTSDGGTFEKSGPGPLLLTGNNTYTGGTIVHGGTLAAGGDQNIGAGPVTIDGGTLSVGSLQQANRDLFVTANGGAIHTGASTTFRTISGAAGGNLMVTGTMFLTGTSVYVGTLGVDFLNIMEQASLQIGDETVFGTLQVASAVNNGRLIFASTTGTTSIAQQISGTGSLEKRGAGTLELTGLNTYNGPTYLKGGTIVAGDSATPLGTGVTYFDGGTLRAKTPVSIGSVVVNAGGGAFDTNGHDSTLLVLTGTGAFHKTGSGQLTLVGGSNIFEGDLSVDAGTLRIFPTATLQIGNGNSRGTLAGNVVADGSLVFNRPGNSTFSGALSGTGSVHSLGSGTLTITAANTFTGTTTIQNGTVSVSGTAGSLGPGHVVNEGHIAFNRSGTLAMNGAISGTGGVTINGPGSVIFSGNNSYTGETTLAGGQLELGSANALGSVGVITLGGGILRFTSANTTDYSARFSTATGQKFAFDTNGQNVTLASSIGANGNSTFTKQGSGTLTLSAQNSYTGGSTISQGTLRIENNTLSPAFSTASSASLELHVGAGEIDFASATGTTTFTGGGNLVKTGAGLAVWKSVAGVFAMSQGSLIDVREGTFTGGYNGNENWTGNLSGLHVAAGATFSGVEANVRVDALTGSGTIRSGYNGAGYQNFTFGVANGSGTFDGTLADTPGHPGKFVKTGTGRQVLTGSSTYSGGTLLLGGELSVSNHGLGTGHVTLEGGRLVVHGSEALQNQVTVTSGTYSRIVTGDLTNSVNATSNLGGATTTAQILAGIASSETTLDTSFHQDADVLSAVYSLNGMHQIGAHTDPFVLQLSLNNITAGLELGWLNASSEWVNARDGNLNNNPAFVQQYAGSFAQFQLTHGTDLSTYMGAWGVQTTGGVTSVWAVLNHNSDFGVIPEPSTAALVVLGSLGCFAARRRGV